MRESFPSLWKAGITLFLLRKRKGEKGGGDVTTRPAFLRRAVHDTRSNPAFLSPLSLSPRCPTRKKCLLSGKKGKKGKKLRRERASRKISEEKEGRGKKLISPSLPFRFRPPPSPLSRWRQGKTHFINSGDRRLNRVAVKEIGEGV